ncbi:antitoxin AF2212-like protein [Thermovibrio ammonificans]|uniref:Uncharacterized protein n=1 Tax=Thermovibrio ammonificans (strain DSM 15698 / JCM 12110 / HB-1) TaxID=648996 RepID=E8T4G0_THEA1|nr:antitoxin AF2212-like protein [Thermovibrio ammonificans]ADU96295.1 hypothetical protein Theam_0322 [Thermovibrio ammonificans HB-1]
MKSVKAVFRNGVFVPLEPCNPKEGTEAIVVFAEEGEAERPRWWDKLAVPEEKKRAVRRLSQLLRSLPHREVRAVVREGEVELFVIVENEREAVKPVMEKGIKVFEETGTYLPIQVISTRRLKRWQELNSPIYSEITSGVKVDEP